VARNPCHESTAKCRSNNWILRGYSYCMDWGICDEQPFWVKAKTGSLLAMPYPIELNDQPAVVYRRNTGAEYAEMLTDNFDEMLTKSEDTALVWRSRSTPLTSRRLSMTDVAGQLAHFVGPLASMMCLPRSCTKPSARC
jgi:hypothetical protein